MWWVRVVVVIFFVGSSSSLVAASIMTVSPGEEDGGIIDIDAASTPGRGFLEEEDYYPVEWGYSTEEDDGECEETHFYHIRGRICVPYRCPRGNSQRNFDTGQCLFTTEEEGGGEVRGHEVKGHDVVKDDLFEGRMKTPFAEMPSRWWTSNGGGLKGFGKMRNADRMSRKVMRTYKGVKNARNANLE